MLLNIVKVKIYKNHKDLCYKQKYLDLKILESPRLQKIFYIVTL